MTSTKALATLSEYGRYSTQELKVIREESLNAVSSMGGDYEEYVTWNRILAFMGLGSI